MYRATPSRALEQLTQQCRVRAEQFSGFNEGFNRDCLLPSRTDQDLPYPDTVSEQNVELVHAFPAKELGNICIHLQ